MNVAKAITNPLDSKQNGNTSTTKGANFLTDKNLDALGIHTNTSPTSNQARITPKGIAELHKTK